MASSSVVEAVDRNSARLEEIAEYLDKLSGGGAPERGTRFQKIANGPFERVIAFNNDERIVLKNPAGDPNDADEEKRPHFSSHGVLTTIWSEPLPGSKVETTFPVDPAAIGGAFQWPKKQKPPWDGPPTDPTNTTGIGFSKQFYDLGDGNTFVTVGPSLPKITPTDNGGAQFWVNSIGVMTQGTGIFQGARGTTTYIGSAYFAKWPAKFDPTLLTKEFKARISTFVKFVPREHL